MQGFEIGINLRVTECLNQGMRAYMEDFATYYFEKSPDKPDSDRIKFAFFGIFDGHGGAEAAKFAKANLLNEIKKIEGFWSTDDNVVLEAIKQGFLNTHKAMWNERANWPKTPRGLESTAGTTASIAIVRNRKLYTGHVGDSAIVLGCRDNRDQSRDLWHAQALTVEHKPSNPKERERIERAGGCLMRKAGVYRVVWRRPLPDTGPKPQFESVPFLAVARSLGDLWSFDKNTDEFHVSPEPDVQCINLDYAKHKCLVLGSDGLWNMVAPDSAVEMVRICERSTELKVFTDPDVPPNFFYNPSGSLVQLGMHRWMRAGLRADNITALVVMLDPPGRPMSQLRGEQRDLTLARLGLQREPASSALSASSAASPSTGGPVPDDRITLQDFLVQCDKWQNANRPGANAHGHVKADAASTAAALAKLTGQPSMPPPSAPAPAQQQSQPALKRQDSDRTLFSPGFRRSSVGAVSSSPPVNFYLPGARGGDASPQQQAAAAATAAGPSSSTAATPSGSGASSSSSSSQALRRLTRSSGGGSVATTPSTTTTPSAQKRTRGGAAAAAAAAASAASTPPSTAVVKRRRLSDVPAAQQQAAPVVKAAATVAATPNYLKRLRRRKTVR